MKLKDDISSEKYALLENLISELQDLKEIKLKKSMEPQFTQTVQEAIPAHREMRSDSYSMEFSDRKSQASPGRRGSSKNRDLKIDEHNSNRAENAKLSHKSSLKIVGTKGKNKL